MSKSRDDVFVPGADQIWRGRQTGHIDILTPGNIMITFGQDVSFILERPVQRISHQDHLPGPGGYGIKIDLCQAKAPLREQGKKDLRRGKGLHVHLAHRTQSSSHTFFQHPLAPVLSPSQALALLAGNMIPNRTLLPFKGRHIPGQTVPASI